MNYAIVAKASATVSLAYGLVTLAFPAAIFSLYGVTLDQNLRIAAQLLASSYVGYGILNFLARCSADPDARRAIAAANAFAWGSGLVISTYAQTLGLLNAFGWTTVALQLVFTVAWAYTYAAERRAPTAARSAPART